MFKATGNVQESVLNLKLPLPPHTLIIALKPSSSSLVRFMSETFSLCSPVLRDYTPLPLITHTYLSATCQLCDLVLFHVSNSSAHILCFTQKHMYDCTSYLRGRVLWSAEADSVCVDSGVCDTFSLGSGSLQKNKKKRF